MNLSWQRVDRWVRRFVVLPLVLLLSACGQKNEWNKGQVVQTPEPRHYPSPTPTTNAIQAEINELLSYPHEHVVTNRPLASSERNPNQRDWFMRTLETGYRASGHTNRRWDKEVHATFAGYADYAHVTNTWSNYRAMTNGLMRALATGCDDPMIGYMKARYLVQDFPYPATEIALALLRAHRVLLSSQYHPAFKFMAGYRAVNAARDADEKGNRSVLIEFVTRSLEDLARDTNAPADEVLGSVEMWIEHTQDKDWIDFILQNLEGILAANWSGETAYQRMMGQVEIGRAWAARGTGFANTVTGRGEEEFQQHLDRAESFLTRAWQQDPKDPSTAYYMMQVELGQGRGRTRMELWFQRAMALYPDYYDAAWLMSWYLQPRWYGSDTQCLEFARQCAANTNWGGSVPLVLANLHASLAQYEKLDEPAEYWHRPQVWQDIQASYEGYFRDYPNATLDREGYARDAYRCGHYAEFLAQLKLLSQTNADVFGGPGKLQEMIEQAKNAAGGQR